MFDQAFKNIDDALHKESGCSSELDYTEQTSWLLFLKYLDALEQDKESEALLEGKAYTPILRLESLYQRKIAALDELKQSLLQQAFSGQLTAQQEETRL